MDLLNDDSKVRAEREKANKVADKFNTFMSSEGGGYAPRNYSSNSPSSSTNYNSGGGGGGYGGNTSPRDNDRGRTYTAPAGAVKASAADDDDDLPVPQPLPLGGSPYGHQQSQYGQPASPYQQQPTGVRQLRERFDDIHFFRSDRSSLVVWWTAAATIWSTTAAGLFLSTGAPAPNLASASSSATEPGSDLLFADGSTRATSAASQTRCRL